jgi:hypothetical protein
MQEKEKDKAIISLNEAAVLREIERLGKGVVCGITVQI